MMLPAAMVAALLAAGAEPAAGAVEGLRETRCMWMVRGADGSLRSEAAPDLRVLEQTALPGPFAPDRPANAEALNCGRTGIVPGEHDEEVLNLGVPFIITEVGNGGRLGALEVSGGQFRFRMIEGSLTEAEEQDVQLRLNLFQSR